MPTKELKSGPDPAGTGESVSSGSGTSTNWQNVFSQTFQWKGAQANERQRAAMKARLAQADISDIFNDSTFNDTTASSIDSSSSFTNLQNGSGRINKPNSGSFSRDQTNGHRQSFSSIQNSTNKRKSSDLNDSSSTTTTPTASNSLISLNKRPHLIMNGSTTFSSRQLPETSFKMPQPPLTGRLNLSGRGSFGLGGGRGGIPTFQQFQFQNESPFGSPYTPHTLRNLEQQRAHLNATRLWRESSTFYPNQTFPNPLLLARRTMTSVMSQANEGSIIRERTITERTVISPRRSIKAAAGSGGTTARLSLEPPSTRGATSTILNFDNVSTASTSTSSSRSATSSSRSSLERPEPDEDGVEEAVPLNNGFEDDGEDDYDGGGSRDEMSKTMTMSWRIFKDESFVKSLVNPNVTLEEKEFLSEDEGDDDDDDDQEDDRDDVQDEQDDRDDEEDHQDDVSNDLEAKDVRSEEDESQIASKSRESRASTRSNRPPRPLTTQIEVNHDPTESFISDDEIYTQTSIGFKRDSFRRRMGLQEELPDLSLNKTMTTTTGPGGNNHVMQSTMLITDDSSSSTPLKQKKKMTANSRSGLLTEADGLLSPISSGASTTPTTTPGQRRKVSLRRSSNKPKGLVNYSIKDDDTEYSASQEIEELLAPESKRRSVTFAQIVQEKEVTNEDDEEEQEERDDLKSKKDEEEDENGGDVSSDGSLDPGDLPEISFSVASPTTSLLYNDSFNDQPISSPDYSVEDDEEEGKRSKSPEQDASSTSSASTSSPSKTKRRPYVRPSRESLKRRFTELIAEKGRRDPIIRPQDNSLARIYRRSKRNRVRPTDFWRSERPVYQCEQDNQGNKIATLVGVSAAHLEPQRTRIAQRKRKTGPKQANDPSAPGKHQGDLRMENILNLSIHNQRLSKKILSAEQQEDRDWVLSLSRVDFKESKNSPGIYTAITKKFSNIAFGKLKFAPLKTKSRTKTGEYVTHFNTIFGKFLLKIEGQRDAVIKTGDYFSVGKGVSYSIVNLRNDEAMIDFTIVKDEQK